MCMGDTGVISGWSALQGLSGELEVFMEHYRSWRQNWFELQEAAGKLACAIQPSDVVLRDRSRAS